MARTITVDLIDRIKTDAREVLRDARRRLPYLAYADLRLEVSEGKSAAAENGESRFSGDDYGFAAGVRVLAGERMVAPGWVGLTLGTADLADLPRRLREALERAYRRAMVNGELKATAREKFGPLGEALADTRLHPIDVREDTVPAVYAIDPRTLPLAEMVAFTTDVSRRVAAAGPAPKYNYISTMTQLSRELFASTEGALIDQSFALTQGMCLVVGVDGDVSQELYDVLGHQRGWEILTDGVDDPLLGFPLHLLVRARERHEHAHLGAQDVRRERADQVVHRAQGIPTRRLHFVGVGGEEDDRRVRVPNPLPDEGRRLEPVHVRHVHVEEDDRGLALEEELERLAPRADRDHALAHVGQRRFDGQALGREIVDHQDVDRIVRSSHDAL